MHCITTRTSELTFWRADRAPLQTKATARRSHTRKRRRSDAWEAMRDLCPRRRGAAQNGTAHAAVLGACVLPEQRRSRRCRGGDKAQQLIGFGSDATLLRPWRPLAASQVLGHLVKPRQLSSWQGWSAHGPIFGNLAREGPEVRARSNLSSPCGRLDNGSEDSWRHFSNAAL